VATVLPEFPTEEQRFVVFFFFCAQKTSVKRLFIKKYFLFRMCGVCCVKRFSLGGKRFADEEIETEVRKWLRQQSQDFYAAGFDALVKRWDKCIMLVEDMSRNKSVF
jgi:hypothetical protein